MATDETDPDLPIPDQGRGAASWLSTLCAGRHLEIVGLSRHGPDAVDVIASMMGHDQELWVVAPCPLGAAALDRFKDLLPVMGGRLWHPNVWAIPDGGVHEGRPYLLVPRFAGDTLSERISDRSLPVAEAVDLAIALCRAVHFAHETGFVALDLSAHQVLLADGRPPMIDLRRTLTRRVLEAEGCWIHGGITGCEAPEVLRGEEVGREADVYSLGAIPKPRRDGGQAQVSAQETPTRSRILRRVRPRWPGWRDGPGSDRRSSGAPRFAGIRRGHHSAEFPLQKVSADHRFFSSSLCSAAGRDRAVADQK